MLNKKNIPLYIALAIPVVMIIIVAAFIYIPGIGSKPKYNFVYVTNTNGYYAYPGQFSVKGGVLVENPIASSTIPNGVPAPKYDGTLYEYNVQTGVASQISIDDAKKLHLDSANISPDGYQVTYGSSGGDGLFFAGGGDYNNQYIKGHNRSTKLNLKLDGNSYGSFQFLGWVE